MAFDDLLLDWFSEPESPADVTVLRAAQRAMATDFEVIVPFGTRNAQPAADAAFELIDQLEDQLSVYRESSEVSQLNARADQTEVVVEQDLFALLVESARITRETAGAFDVCVGSLIKVWGFYGRQGRVPTPAERSEAASRAGTRFLVLNADRRTVKYLRKGLEINLGSIGKGYALDRVVSLLRGDWAISSALVHGGSSSVASIGAPPGQARGWPVALRHPWQMERSLGTIYLRHAALGTSAATFQHFEYNGEKLGHLLDPRTAWPAAGVEQVSVVAASAAQADALSTAFYVLGPEKTAQYCRSHPEVGVVLLPSGADEPLTFNLSPEMYSPRVSARR